jgi:nicotinamide-nucleotide amidase
LVHFGCTAKGRPTTHRVMLYGDIGRAQVRIRALETALGMIMDQMLRSPSADAA